jgi:peroxiredoxin
MALTFTPQPTPSETLPAFRLPGVDGKIYTEADLRGKPASVVMFICNHCPYVKAIEDRLITLGKDLQALGVPALAICSNDSSEHPEDSFPELQKRWKEKSYPFPYLHDSTQEAAHTFGAVCTPDFFVYNNKGQLAYRGRLDDSWKDPSKVTRRELFEAVKNILAGQEALAEQKPSMGCSIKWLPTKWLPTKGSLE